MNATETTQDFIQFTLDIQKGLQRTLPAGAQARIAQETGVEKSKISRIINPIQVPVSVAMALQKECLDPKVKRLIQEQIDAA